MPKLTKKIVIPSVIVIVLVVIIFGYFVYRHYHNKPNNYPTVTTQQGKTVTANPNVPGGSSKNPSSGINSGGPDGSSASPPADSNIQPIAPVGNFVSNHHPSSANDTEVSSCSTSTGVQCQIKFTNGSQTKQLPSKSTDSSGNVSWSWTPASIGLTSGQWKITATATSGNNVTSASDVMPLVIP